MARRREVSLDLTPELPQVVARDLNFYYREHSDFVNNQNEEIKKSQSSKQPTISRRFNPKK